MAPVVWEHGTSVWTLNTWQTTIVFLKPFWSQKFT
jgi:hypothetical protein